MTDTALPSSSRPLIHQRLAAEAQALRGRVIAITGASGGVGHALALAAAAQGAELLLIGRSVSKLEALHAQIGQLGLAQASIAPLDLEKALARDYDQLADAVLQRYGRLDGLVHCAALLGAPAPIEHYDVPTWCRVLHVNLTAAFALTQVLMPAMRQSSDASIIFSSCALGRRAQAYAGAYAVAQFGLEALSQTLAQEVESAGTARVNVLNPGALRSRLRTQAFPAEDPAALPAPEQVIAPYLWLLSAASRGVNGQSLDCQAGS